MAYINRIDKSLAST